ncbi:MAG TPA: CHAT domain-containing protein [Candidatus Polarisedimenticolaceae bacterium]|nr:CHAT domain-containing protein [Candidatus Polarisedimenticolaceae bacterium]
MNGRRAAIAALSLLAAAALASAAKASLWSRARAAYLRQDCVLATRLYARALERARRSEDGSAQARARIGLGRCALASGDLDGAEGDCRQALELARSAGDERTEVDALVLLAHLAYLRNDWSQTVERAQAATGRMRELGQSDGLAGLGFELGIAKNSLGQYAAALGPFEEALPWLEAHPDGRLPTALRALGFAYQSLGRSDEALARYRGSADAARRLGDAGAEAASLQRLGLLQLELKHAAEAEPSLERARALFRETGPPREEAVTLAALAELRKAQGDHDGRLALLEQEIAPLTAAGETAGLAYVLQVLFLENRTRSRYAQVVDFGERWIAVLRTLGDRLAEAQVQNLLGISDYQQGNFLRALERYRPALALVRELHDRPMEGNLLLNLCEAERETARFDLASEHCQAALEIFREVGDRLGESYASNDLGTLDLHAGRNADAPAKIQRAIAISHELGERGVEAMQLGNLALAYDYLGRFAEAQRTFEQALAIERELGDRRAEASTLHNLASLHSSIGQEARAIELYREALAIHREFGDRKAEAITMFKLGEALEGTDEAKQLLLRAMDQSKELGDLETWANAGLAATRLLVGSGLNDSAVALVASYLAELRKLGNLGGVAGATLSLGDAHFAQNNYEEARADYERALALERTLGDPLGEAGVLRRLMNCSKRLGRDRLAVLWGKRAVNLLQDVRASLRSFDRQAQSSFLASKESTYRMLIDLLLAQGRLDEAQQVVAMLKQEEYFDFIRRDGAEAGGLDARMPLTPEEAELDQRYAEISGQLGTLGAERAQLLAQARTPEADTRLAQLEAQLETANQAFQRFLDALPAQLPDTREAGEKLRDVRAAQALMSDLAELGRGTVAIYTIVAEDKILLILTTQDFQKSYESAIPRAELGRKVFALQQALRNPGADPHPAAQELYTLIVAPLAADLEQAGAQTLMWSLDGVLRYVPVAALWDGERYLIERYRNTVFTPASMARLKDPPRRDWRVLGLGVSRAWADFPALPGVRQELEGIVPRVFPGEVKLDDGFTKDGMKAALRGGFPVVHIASHFAFRPGSEADSYLLLGDGGHLDLGEIRASAGHQLFRGVDLLTLSACDTAAGGTSGDGREVEGFAVIAQDQGAKAVVASLWPVSDESTQLLMQEFYRRRAARPADSKVEALRGAQLALLRGELGRGTSPARRGVALENAPQAEGFSHPYFWAPFILIGNWR